MKFEVARNFRIKLFSMVSALPMSRHTDHHSGETIDQVNKAVDALQAFSGNNYMYTSTVLKFVSSVGMLVRIRPIAGVSLFVM